MIAPACVLAIAFAFAAEPADFEDAVDRAEAHFERGQQLQESDKLDEARREYLQASAAFGEAYEITKRPEFIYARAQAERLGGRCDVAVKYYDEFLASGPPTAAVDDAKINRKRCTASEPPPVVPPPKVPTEGSAGPPTPGDTPRRQWVRDPAGGVLVALGGVTGVIGVSLIAFAATRDGSAGSAGTEDEYVNRKDAARVQHRVGIAATAVGGAMLVAGIARWSVLAARERRQRVSASVSGSRRGAALTVSVWF